MIIPYEVDVPQLRRPVSNDIIILLTVLIFVFQHTYPEQFGRFVCEGFCAEDLFGYIWLHADIIHLTVNLIFLYVFGNAVCSKIGNIAYPFFYTALGLAAGIGHLLASGKPIIGASGAIFGIVGMYLVLFPFNQIKCVFFIFVYFKRIKIASLWVILWWVLLNIFNAVFFSDRPIGYIAHLAGFFTGIVFACALIHSKMLKRDSTTDAILRSIKP